MIRRAAYWMRPIKSGWGFDIASASDAKVQSLSACGHAGIAETRSDLREIMMARKILTQMVVFEGYEQQNFHRILISVPVSISESFGHSLKAHQRINPPKFEGYPYHH